MTGTGPDIFTEQAGISPDTLAHLGPLKRLAGVWSGTSGGDIAPKAQGPEAKPFVEQYELQPIDAQSNGPQLLYGLRYHRHINTPGEAATFHDQIGYWLWEPATGLIMQTLAIPRGQVALLAGHADADAKQIVLEATRGKTDYGICSTAFLEHAFRTDHDRLTITFNDDDTWSYASEVTLAIEGQDAPFVHRDHNLLKRIGAPDLNPWLQTVGLPDKKMGPHGG